MNNPTQPSNIPYHTLLYCFITPLIPILLYTLIKGGVLSNYKKFNESSIVNTNAKDTAKDTSNDTSNDEDNTAPSIWQQIINAIRIFGYLETSIIKELVDTMYTQRVDAGDMLILNNRNPGLIVVLEGSFQLYHKLNNDNSTNPVDEDMDQILLKDGMGRFQLLNIIKKGNPLSSLLDMLQLFIPTSPSDNNHGEDEEDDNPTQPTLIARATVESTIAIIPSTSFNKLLYNHPRDASHLIQTILNRLYQVNFQITHSYLGLTNELLQIEQTLNTNNNFKLPFYLVKNVISSFNNVQETKSSNHSIFNALQETKSSNHSIFNALQEQHLHHSSTFSVSSISTSLDQDDDNVSWNNNNNINTSSNNNINNEENSDLENGAGDDVLKMTIVENIFKFWGITKNNFTIINPMTMQKKSSSASSSSLSKELKILPSSIAIVKGQPPLEKPIQLNNHSNFIKESQNNIEPRPKNSLNYHSAKSDFAKYLNLKFYSKGTTIVKQDTDSRGLFYIISGKINITLSIPTDNNTTKEQLIYTVADGGIAGYLSSLIGYRSFVNLKTQTDCYVAFISNDMLEILFEKYYSINLKIAESLINNISLKIWKLDHALEWVPIRASTTLFNQGEPANGIYVILSGRLRQYQSIPDTSDNSTDNDDSKPKTTTHVIGELAQGESFGEVEVLSAMNRSSTIVAVRDSELARLPRSLFELLATEHPSIVIKVSRMVVKKLLDVNQNNNISSSISTITTMTSPTTRSLIDMGHKYDLNSSPPTKNNASHHHSYSPSSVMAPHPIPGNISYRTITILPITNGLPVESFAMKLVQAFKQVGKNTIGLTQRATLLHLGRHAFDKLSKLKQGGYFADLEHTYNIVVYIADTSVNSSWTKTCIDQGDCILLLGDATSSCQIGEYENLLLRSKTSARTELILLHGERYMEPGLTQKWLSIRPWVDSHHHVQFETGLLARTSSKNGGVFNRTGISLLDKITQTELGRRTYKISKLLPDSVKNTVGGFSARLIRRKRHAYNPIHSHKNDFLRLARLLSGQAIGLVLGGGGAKGISHLGVLQALEEQGIPVDIIGGTSIGSFIGGIYAQDYDVVPIYGRIKKFAGRVSSIWRMLSDLTWPVTSYTTGHEFNRGVWKTFGDTRIEDFWIQFYCNSTNITESVQEIHSFGYAWRYIRASMSLAGLLPPLEENGSMLLDGGYVDNLPVDEMKARGCKTIFAVDVGSVDDKTPMNYGDSLNGFWIIFNRWNPFSSHPNIPNMAEIQMRLGYVASVNALEKAKHTPGVIYARPPIDGFNTLDFAKFEDIYQVGVQYGREFFQDLIENDKMPFIPGARETIEENRDPVSLLYRRNSM
ncbi:lysophospholipase Nte1p [Monosporozyma servazzii]